MVTGRRKTGGADGGEIRTAWMLVGWTEWLGPPSNIWVRWTVFPSPFRSWLTTVAAFTFYSVCVPPLLSFSSLLCLLSCLHYRYPSIRSSVFRFFCPALSYHFAQFAAGPSPFSTRIDSPSLLFPDVVLSSSPFTPSQIDAELLHTVHTCLVPRCNICIS